MRTPTIFPGIPVPNEYTIIDSSTRFSLFDLIESLLRLTRCIAIREDIHGKSNAFAIWRNDKIAYIQRLIRDLPSLPAVNANTPNL